MFMSFPTNFADKRFKKSFTCCREAEQAGLWMEIREVIKNSDNDERATYLFGADTSTFPCDFLLAKSLSMHDGRSS